MNSLTTIGGLRPVRIKPVFSPVIITTYVYPYLAAAIQNVTIPANAVAAYVQLWGAGGSCIGVGGSGGTAGIGGAGGYTAAYINVTGGSSMSLIVGQQGSCTTVNAPNTWGGGGGSPAGGDSGWSCGSGGGRSAIQISGTEIVTAGGGGASGRGYSGNFGQTGWNGGAGGGLVGGTGLTTNGGLGGTQSAGGGIQNTVFNNTVGTSLQGGLGTKYCGGGGGGLFGGGGGGVVGNYAWGGGGGGSSYCTTNVYASITPTLTQGGLSGVTANAAALPPGYSGSTIGFGGPACADVANTPGNSGGNGLITIEYVVPSTITVGGTGVCNQSLKGSVNSFIFTSGTSTFKLAANTVINLVVIGAGGGGASANGNSVPTNCGGGGGGAGGFIQTTFNCVGGVTYNITIGTPGTYSTPAVVGTAGTSTSFNSTFIAGAGSCASCAPATLYAMPGGNGGTVTYPGGSLGKFVNGALGGYGCNNSTSKGTAEEGGIGVSFNVGSTVYYNTYNVCGGGGGGSSGNDSYSTSNTSSTTYGCGFGGAVVAHGASVNAPWAYGGGGGGGGMNGTGANVGSNGYPGAVIIWF